LKAKLIFLFLSLAVLPQPARCGHTLSAEQRKVLGMWLGQHGTYRIARDADCRCADSIQYMKDSYGAGVKALADFHPYVVTGDFNGDGEEDFAVAVVDRSKKTRSSAVLVFNGPLGPDTVLHPFIMTGLDLDHQALFFGPPASKPYRLSIGYFESDYFVEILPKGKTYRLKEADCH
jgi:hypothetical protein